MSHDQQMEETPPDYNGDDTKNRPIVRWNAIKNELWSIWGYVISIFQCFFRLTKIVFVDIGNWGRTKIKTKRGWVILGAVGVLIMLPFLFLAYSYLIETRNLTVVQHEIKAAHLPQEFDGYKIVFLTDIHQGSRGTFDMWEQIDAIVEKESPDLILWGGDYSKERKEFAIRCFEQMGKLKAPGGAYAVLGNHDYWARNFFREEIAKKGVTLLENQAVWLTKGNAKIRLVGVEDFWEGSPILSALRRDATPSTNNGARDFVVLLSHNPNYFEALTKEERDQIDLMLSGHSHGGQITLFGVYAPRQTTLEKYRTDRIKPTPDGNTTVIVSNGIGTTGLPLRLFAPPQVIVITLRK